MLYIEKGDKALIPSIWNFYKSEKDRIYDAIYYYKKGLQKYDNNDKTTIYFKLIDVYTKLNDKHEIAYYLLLIGRSYINKDIYKVKEYFLLSFDTYYKDGENYLAGKVIYELAEICLINDEINQAYEYFDYAGEIFKNDILNTKKIYKNCELKKGDILVYQNKYNEAYIIYPENIKKILLGILLGIKNIKGEYSHEEFNLLSEIILSIKEKDRIKFEKAINIYHNFDEIEAKLILEIDKKFMEL